MSNIKGNTIIIITPPHSTTDITGSLVMVKQRGDASDIQLASALRALADELDSPGMVSS